MALCYNMHLTLREIKGNKNLVEIVSFKKKLYLEKLGLQARNKTNIFYYTAAGVV